MGKSSLSGDCRVTAEIEDHVTDLNSTLITKRLKAVKALGRMKSPLAVEPLKQILNDRSKEVRSAAVEALTAINPPELSGILLPIARDRSIDVRLRVAYSLGLNPTDDAVECLQEMLRDQNDPVAAMAGKSLAKAPQKCLAVLVRQFSDKSWKIRARSATAICRMGKAAIHALESGLEDSDSNVRYWSSVCLGRLRDKSFSKQLLGKLQDKDVGVRIAALRGLREIGDPTMTNQLLEALSNPSEQLRDIIFEMLKDFGSHSIPFLMESLSSEHWMGRSLAAKTLTEIGTDAVEPLSRALEDQNKERRYWAIRILGQMREETAYSEIRRFLSDPDSEIRMAAVLSLGNFTNVQSVPLLIERFIDPSWVIRKEACKAVIGHDLKAVPVLVKALSSVEEDIRYWSLRALGEIKPVGIHTQLVKLFKDKSWNIRKTAAEVLGKYGEEILLDLTNLATESDSEIRFWALQALGKIRAEISLPLLFRALEDQSEAIRNSAQKALSNYGSQILEDLLSLFKSDKRRLLESVAATFHNIPEEIVVPKLCHWLGKYDEHVNYWIRKTLCGFGKRAHEQALPLLQSKSNEIRRQAVLLMGELRRPGEYADIIQLLKDEYWPTRIAAAEALGRIGGPDAVDPLLDALDDDDENLALAAIQALGHIGDERAVPGLITSIGRESWTLRFHAINILGAMKVKRAIPDLLRLLDEDTLDLKIPIIKALGEIGSGNCLKQLLDRFPGITDLDLKVAYITAFGGLGNPDAIPVLIGLAGPGTLQPERRAAIKSLGQLGARDARAVLLVAVKESDQVISREAMVALRQVLTPQDYDRLDQILATARKRQDQFQHFFQEGLRFIRLGSISDAEKALKSAISINPRAAYVYSALGNLYYKSGKLIDATKAYVMATQIEPRDITLKMNLGMVYFRRRAYKESLDVFDKIAKNCDPQSQQGLYAAKMIEKIRSEGGSI